MTQTSLIREWLWTRERTALAAVLCLMAGIAGGWWMGAVPITGLAFTRPAQAVSAPSQNAETLKNEAAAQAAPLLKRLESNPQDVEALIGLGNLYYDARQYQPAIDTYAHALALRPSDAAVRTDMATAFWYLGNTDRALAEFDKALAVAPDNPNTLFNRGLVRWRGKQDSHGALADWRKLLATDPTYEAKDQVEKMIAEVESKVPASQIAPSN